MKEEILFRLSMLEQQSQELKKNIETIDVQINDLQSLKLSLHQMKGSKDKDVLAPLGRGIFVKTKVEDEKFFVNVGSKILVRKKPEETAEIIDRQILEMDSLKMQIMENIDALNHELEHLMEEAKKEEK